MCFLQLTEPCVNNANFEKTALSFFYNASRFSLATEFLIYIKFREFITTSIAKVINPWRCRETSIISRILVCIVIGGVLWYCARYAVMRERC